MFIPSVKSFLQKLNRLNYITVNKDCFDFILKPELFRQELLDLINSACSRIYITALYFQNDECGKELLTAIYERAKNTPHLQVYIMVDFHRAQRGLMGKGDQTTNVTMYQEYQSKYNLNNVHILGVPVKSKEIFGVLHLKGFVFDNILLYSGASINNIYLGYEGKYRLDRYHKIKSKELTDSIVSYLRKNLINSTAVKDIAKLFIPNAKDILQEIQAFKQQLKVGKYEILGGIADKDSVRVCPMVGLGNFHNILNESIVSLIKSARKEITICTPYFNPPRQISKAIIGLLNKGIKVTLIVGDKIANDFFIPENQPFNRVGAVPYLYENFLRNFCSQQQKFINSGLLNVMLWKDGTNTFHVKGIFVDHTYYLLTGNNLNPRAWRLDIENGILIQDSNLLLKEKFDQEKEYLLKHTKRISNYTELETIEDIPECYRKYLKKFYRFKLHLLIKNII